MKKVISYSAPAKVILSGEHAVVYGKPALVSAVDLRLSFSLWKSQNSNNHLDRGRDSDGTLEYIANLTKNFLKRRIKLININDYYQYQIDSNIPISRGLGSSASFSVATTAAFLEFFSGQQFGKEIINDLAYQAEKKFHQNPSGVDNAASCFGGLIYYRREFDFLKNINHLPFHIPKEIENKLFLIDSGKPKETTAEMVSWVKKNYSRKTEMIFSQIETLTKKMVLSLKEKNISEFKKAIFDNERCLEQLGVVSSKTKTLLNKLSQFGIGKITGAGGRKKGSGFILFFAQKKEELIDFFKNEKINYFKFIPDYSGLVKMKNA